MSIATTLEAAQAQLAFWKQECEAAHLQNDPDRIAVCEKYIAQCEAVISALQANQPIYDALRRATQSKAP